MTSTVGAGARHRHPPDRQQLVEMETQADAEHQQHDADLGKLLRHLAACHEAGGVRTHGDASQQISDDGRDPDPLGDETQDEGDGEAAGEGQDDIMVERTGTLCGKSPLQRRVPRGLSCLPGANGCIPPDEAGPVFSFKVGAVSQQA